MGFETIVQPLLSGIVKGSIYALTAVGLTLVYKIIKLANFSHGELFVFGGYLGIIFFNCFFVSNPVLNTILSFVIAFFGTALLAIFFDFIAYKPLRMRDATPLMIMISSLGVGIIIRGVIQFICGPDLKSYLMPAQSPINIAGGVIYPSDIAVIIGVMVIFITVHFIMTKTKFGCSLRAISDNKELAEVSGIDTEKTIIWVWVLSGGLAGLSGAIFAGALYLGMIPTQGFGIILLIFAAAIVGTIGHIYGAIIGGYIIGFVDEISGYHFGKTLQITEYSKIVVFIVLIIVIILMPKGIFGRK